MIALSLSFQSRQMDCRRCHFTALKKIRVLIVDDSAFMRRFFEDLISSEPDIEVVGKARNGADAIRKIASLNPDLVTMDVEMPEMDGVSALKEIMKGPPLPVIMLSTLTSRGADITLECLETGAFDFIQKPSSREPVEMEKIGKRLLAKIRMASSSMNIQPQAPSKIEKKALLKSKKEKAFTPLNKISRTKPELLLIASSTGGPQALSRFLPEIPGDFPAPIVIVQHMPAGFTRSLARRLDGQCRIPVCEARQDMQLVPGRAVLAPGGYHLILKRNSIGMFCSLSDLPPVNSVRPAADCLFNSAALFQDIRSTAVILTGMGRDGTNGAKALRENGAFIFAESEETSVVFGMPRSAIEAGIVDLALPIYDLPKLIVNQFKDLKQEARD